MEVQSSNPNYLGFTCKSHTGGRDFKETNLEVAQVLFDPWKRLSSNVRESKTILDSGFQELNSGLFQGNLDKRPTWKWLRFFLYPWKRLSSNVRESKTVLDSGFHAVDSGFQELDSGLRQWKLDSGWEKFVGFRIPWVVLWIPSGPGFWIPQRKISQLPGSTSNNFPESGTWISFNGMKTYQNRQTVPRTI